MCRIEEFLNDIFNKSADGTLLIKEAPIGHYLRITSGKHKGKIFPNHYRKSEIDDREVVHFCHNLCWIFFDDVKQEHCKLASLYQSMDYKGKG